MAVFFELTTDVFKERFDKLARSGPQTTRAGSPSARRPMRGLEVKEDTHAVIKVIDLMGREIRLADSGNASGTSSSYTNFILQSVQESRAEKSQILETFGDPYLFVFGESARFLECTAMLLNSQDFNWQAEFWHNYDTYLRGTKCAEIGARVYLFYDDTVVEGYMLNAVASIDSMNPMAVPLQFRMFLTNYRNISMIGDPRFPVRAGVSVDFAQQYQDASTGLFTEGGSPSPVRGLIADNLDEWTGTPIADDPDYAKETEIEDIIAEAVAFARANAAKMNSVDSIYDAGLNNANNGYGSGQAPAKKPDTPTCGTNAEGKVDCASYLNGCKPGSEYTADDGTIMCTSYSGAQIPGASSFCSSDCGVAPPPANAPKSSYSGRNSGPMSRAEEPQNYSEFRNSTSSALHDDEMDAIVEEAVSRTPAAPTPEPTNSSGAFTSTVIPNCDPSVASC